MAAAPPLDALVRRFATLVAVLATRDHGANYIGHLMDIFFVSMVDALAEQHARPQKTVADMMGLSIRSFEHRLGKARRHMGSRGRTVWGEIYRVVRDEGPLSRAELELRFAAEDPLMVASVLRTMRDQGALEERICGTRTTFAVSALPELDDSGPETDSQVVLVALFINGDRTLDALCRDLAVGDHQRGRVVDALAELVRGGAIQRLPGAEACYRAVGYALARSADTTSAALFDHLDAVLGAVGHKLSGPGSADGSTYRLSFEANDPRIGQIQREVDALRTSLGRTRRALDHEAAERGEVTSGVQVTFYLGQSLDTQ